MTDEATELVQQENPTPASPPRHQATTLSEYLESLLITVILALFVTSFILQAFKIPSQSMEKTLLVGDHLLVNKFIFGGHDDAWYEKLLPYRPLQRGDIIVFKYPYDDHQHFVERDVYINGKLLIEPYVVHDPSAGYDPLNYRFPPTNNQFLGARARSEWISDIKHHVKGDEIIVPPGKFFAMGDNRDLSSDSRYWGFVDRDAIMGRPFLIYWSVEATADDYAQNSTFFQRLAGIADTLAHLPARTRWNRMLRIVH